MRPGNDLAERRLSWRKAIVVRQESARADAFARGLPPVTGRTPGPGTRVEVVGRYGGIADVPIWPPGRGETIGGDL